MSIRKLILLCGVLLAPMLLCWRAAAQAVANGEIHGVVQDSSGAVVVNAQVKALQTETAYSQTAVTGADGSYLFPGLPVGAYTVEVTAPSFIKYVQSGIVLQVGQNVAVNISLKLGAVTQEVHVSANASMVQTQETSVSQVIDQRRIVDIPLNGRELTSLILLSGGATSPPVGSIATSHDSTHATVISVSGGQLNGNNYLLDGADNNDSHSNVNMPYPFPDAVQEFSVQTSGVSARYGLHPGSVVNVVTKQGTNSIHGSLFEFVRNGALNALTYPATVQDSLRRNQYGGTLGGPIVKNKLFLFGGVQETAIRTSPSTTTAYVATQQELNGDFSTEESSACQTGGAKTMTDPTTGRPFSPANQIDPRRYTKPSTALLALMPVSNDPCGKFIFAIPNPSNEYQVISRLDWNQSQRNSVIARYFILDYNNPSIYTHNILTTSRPGTAQRSQSIVLGDQFIFSPHILNSFRVGFTRLVVNRSNSSQIPNMRSLGSNIYVFVPNFINLSVSGFFSAGGSSNAPAAYIRNTWQFADDMDWIRGRHHFSLGGEFIAGQMDATNIDAGNGIFSFSPNGNENALADYLLGVVNSYQDSNQTVTGLRQKYVGLYFQDSVQLTKQLNIHAGVRWEPSFPEYDSIGTGNAFSMPNFVAGKITSLYTNAPAGLLFHGDPGIPKAYAFGSYDDFAPHVGFAWQPQGNEKMSVRGSYGIFFNQPESYTDSVFGGDSPWGNSITLTRPAGGLVDPFSDYPGGNPYPVPVPPTKTSFFPTASQYYFLPLNLHHPYMQQWDLGIQQQFAEDWMVALDYIGNKSTHFRGGKEINPAIYIPGKSTTKNTQARRDLTQINSTWGPYYANLTYMDDGLNLNYNALRASVQHRFSQRYSLLAVYTWSKCLEDATPIPDKLALTESDPYNRDHDYGPCDFDVRNNFVASLIYAGHKFENRPLNLIAGGWQTGAVVTAYNGFPLNVTTGTDASLSGVGMDRPDAVPGVNPYLKNSASHQWLNPAAFTPNGPATFGNVQMNSLVGPHYVDVDANLQKVFSLYREADLQLRFEFFNLLNHTNYALPTSSLSSSHFGNLLSAQGNGRILQLAAKIVF